MRLERFAEIGKGYAEIGEYSQRVLDGVEAMGESIGVLRTRNEKSGRDIDDLFKRTRRLKELKARRRDQQAVPSTENQGDGDQPLRTPSPRR